MSSVHLPSTPRASASASCRCSSVAAGPCRRRISFRLAALGPVIRGDALRAGRVNELLRGATSVLRRRTVAARWSFSPGLKVSTEDLAKAGLAVSE